MSKAEEPYAMACRGIRQLEEYLDNVARFQAWVLEHGDPKPEPSAEEWREINFDDDAADDGDAD